MIDLILKAEDAGFFRDKLNEEQLEDFYNDIAKEFGPEALTKLEAEKNRRKKQAEDRRRQRLAKAEREAAKPIASGSVNVKGFVEVNEGNIFVFTCAQNNTHVHSDFLTTLLHYCKERSAVLKVGTCFYNKNGFQNATKDSEGVWFDPLIQPYIDNSNFLFNGKVAFIGTANILPTATNPLNGFGDIVGPGITAVIPHVKQEMLTVPALKGAEVSFRYSSGAVTLRNYIQKRNGQAAERLHRYGAVVAEFNKEKGVYFLRHLQYDDTNGGFYDLNRFYSKDGYCLTEPVLAVNWGDIHAEKIDDKLAAICWDDSTGIAKTLNPHYQFVHDLLDFSSRNHHNIKDHTFLFERFATGKESVKDDIQQAADLLKRMAHAGYPSNIMIVKSNHDQALDRWLKETDFKDDPVNAVIYLQLTLEMYQSLIAGKDFDAFKHAIFSPYIIDNPLPDNGRYTFLGLDESFQLAGIEFGCHGHLGINGSKGSPGQFKKLGLPMNTGHTHSPNITGNVYTAGVTGSLNMGYNCGPSGWAQAHIVTYMNGSRCIVVCMQGTDGELYWKA